MLLNLYIENILLIEKLTIDFNKGLSVITGQTGAGKSILLDSLNIILGDRASPTMIRNDADKGIIIATFNIKNLIKIRELLNECGYNNNDNTLIIKKIITRNGSKVLINDTPTTINFINQISDYLIEIHGQFEQVDLMQTHQHLLILDNFIKFQDIPFNNKLNNIKNLHNAFKNKEKEFLLLQETIAKEKQNEEYNCCLIKLINLENILH